MVEAKESESGEKKLKEKREGKKNELAELKELLQRTQANFENYRKQQEKRNVEIREMADKDLILQILPLLDNFELALKSAGINAAPDDFLKGMELIYSQFVGILSDNGVKAIETKDKDFDPYYHEALIRVSSEFPENKIIEELQKGFTLYNKVIRHARVKISTGRKTENSEKEKQEKEFDEDKLSN